MICYYVKDGQEYPLAYHWITAIQELTIRKKWNDDFEIRVDGRQLDQHHMRILAAYSGFSSVSGYCNYRLREKTYWSGKLIHWDKIRY